MDFAAPLAAHGLSPLGAFHPGPDDGVPGAPGTLVLVGGVGNSFWAAFEGARRDESDPLDAWSRRVIDGVARQVGATALYPFEGPPWLPFQRWAMEALGLKPSPLGLLIHPEHGLWLSWRGALAFAERRDLPPPPRPDHACDACPDRPCLHACPVAAFRNGGYDIPACLSHLREMQGVECREWGCRARRACPVGRAHIHPPAQARFHMQAFLWTRGGAGS
ncbi:MAG: ferredoxin [Magnetospirillum sp. WYHS-4]